MKAEIKKLFYNNAFICVILITMVACFIGGVFYNKSCESAEISEYEPFQKYDSDEDLSRIIQTKRDLLTTLEIGFAEGKILSETYNEQVEETKREIAYYEYLLSSGFVYGEATKNVTRLTKEKYNFISYISPFLTLFFIAVIFPSFSYFIVNYEFSSGAYRFVYIGQNREKTILKKFAVYFFSVMTLAISATIIIVIMAQTMQSPFKYILVYLNGSVKSYSVNKFIFYELLSALIQIAVWAGIFFSASIHVKNGLFLFVTDLIILLLLTLFSLSGGHLGAFCQSMTKVDVLGLGIIDWIIATLSIAVVASVCLVLSVKLFKRKELC